MPRSCSVEGCDRAARALGWCNMHYLRVWDGGDLGPAVSAYVARASYDRCTAEGCKVAPRSRTSPYCEKHYYRLRRTGTLETANASGPFEACAYCGGESHGRQFCGGKCAARFKRGCPRTVSCQVCEVEFEPINGATTCSVACGAVRDREAFRSWRQKALTDPEYRIRYNARMFAAYHKRRQVIDAAVERISYVEVFERDGWGCQLCGQPVDRSVAWPHPLFPSLDHIVPLSKGGRHEIGNVQLAHLRCNLSKGDSPLGSSKATAHDRLPHPRIRRQVSARGAHG